MRDSFVFYRSFYEALLGMSSENQGDCLMAVANYAINGIEPEGMTPEVRMFFTLVKPQIDKNNQKYENGKNGGRPNNQTETKIKPKNNQTETKPKANVNDNVNVNVNLNNIPPKNKFSDENIILSPYTGNEKCSSDCERKAKFEINGQKFCGQHTRIELSKFGRLDLIPTEKFIKPTVDEIDTYCRESKNYIDVGRFYDFYESKGWKVGKNPMKDWRAAVRNWARGDKSAPASRKTTDDNYDDIFGVC